ncbi:hypothetical protein [Longirhabdus pacifica]|uniref:hypothetical protein n=1 Tax=Longirhabdus pacifica TaxID=2305227 RepID=UPI00100873DF|nr:hypothetical protein [Longirhabdus pacifica]
MRKWITISVVFCLMIVLLAAPVQAEKGANSRTAHVNIFDIQNKKILSKVPVDGNTEKEANHILQSLDSIVDDVTIGKNQQIAVRIPLQEPVKVHHRAFENQVKTMILFASKGEPPYLLLFTSERKPMIFTFKHDVKDFFNKLGIYEMLEKM